MTAQRTSLPAWCQHIVSNPDRYAVLDSETTGLHGECIDLAIVSIDGTALFNKLLRPKCKIEKEAMAIHGITESMVAGAKTFAEEFPEIQAALSGKEIIAYNAAFDKERLWHTAREHGVSLPYMEWHCLMKRYASFWGMPGRYGEFRWQKLQDACRQQRIALKQTHRALSDALAVVKLIQRLAELGNDARRWTGESEE